MGSGFRVYKVRFGVIWVKGLRFRVWGYMGSRLCGFRVIWAEMTGIFLGM